MHNSVRGPFTVTTAAGRACASTSTMDRGATKDSSHNDPAAVSRPLSQLQRVA